MTTYACGAGQHFEAGQGRCIVDYPVYCPDGYINAPTNQDYTNCILAPQPLPALDGVGLLISICGIALAGLWRAAQ